MGSIQQSRPSYHQGFARSAGESAYPGLWDRLGAGWCPNLGATGTTLYDVSGRNNHGTFSGLAASDWGMSPEGAVITPDGGAEGVDVSGYQLPLSGPLTIVVKAKLPAQGQGAGSDYDFILFSAKTGTTIDNFVLYFNDGTTLRALPLSPATGTTIDYTVALDDNLWHQIVYMRDASNHWLFLDGVQVGTNASPCVFSGTPAWHISVHALDTIARGWDGEIGNIWIYERKLSFQEREYLRHDPSAPLRLRYPIFKAPVVGGLSIPIAAYHYNHHLRSMT